MIGGAHRHAMWLDNQYVLAAGIFGRDRAASTEFAKSLGVERVYADYHEMPAREADRDDGVDVVAIVTPNDPFRDSESLPRKGHRGGVREAADQRLRHSGRPRRRRCLE
jgi:hypothetical protein